MSAIAEHLHDQFRLPRGPLGRLAGWVMATRPSNRARSGWTVDLLQLAPNARVLELGYGPGLGIQAALRAAPDGHVTGLDHSLVMRATASRRNAAAIRSGRALLLVGDAQDPPDGLGTFDAIFGCNVWLFWPGPVATLSRLAALLRPGGRIAVTHQPRGGSAGPADTTAATNQLEAHLLGAGLTGLRRCRLDLQPTPAVCVLATSRGVTR